MSEQPCSVIRHPQLTGEQDIYGIWFPIDWFSESLRLQLMLKNWQKEATIHRFAHGDLLCFPLARRQHCERSEGWPLTRQGNTLCSAPLESSEIALLPPADLWLVRGGQVESLRFTQAEQLSLADWIDIDSYPLQDTYSCFEPDTLNQIPLLGQEQPVREILGNQIPPASEQQKRFLAAAHTEQHHHASNNKINAKIWIFLLIIASLSLWICMHKSALNDNVAAQPIALFFAFIILWLLMTGFKKVLSQGIEK